MEVSGQLHALVALPPEKDPHSRYPLDRRLGRHQSRSGSGGEEKIFQPLLRIEPPNPARPARSQSLIVTSEILYELKWDLLL
jgi:hypothetical protein